MHRFDRSDIRDKLCFVLRKKYVALLAQRGASIDLMENALLDPEMSYSGMKFIKVPLPTDTESEHGFEYLFLQRLLGAISHLPGEMALIEHVKQTEANCPASYTMTLRIKAVLDALGWRTSNLLVIILRTSIHVADGPLKILLTMLREYSDQLGNYGTPGDKLRFMVVGDAYLWDLCYHKTPVRSPFNIAYRMLLDGFSLEELQKIDISKNVASVSRFHILTGGVPVLVEEVIERKDDNLQDFSTYFHCLWDDWNALALEAQDALKGVARGTLKFPECKYDHKCVQIPIVDGPWQDAFWKGFLRLKFGLLIWRSPIHHMFVRRLVNDNEDCSASPGMNIGLQESIACLEKAMQKESYGEYRDEMLREAHALAYQISMDEMYAPLEAILHQETNEKIVEKCQQVSEKSDKDWVKVLGEQALQYKDRLGVFLIKTVLSRSQDFVADPNTSLSSPNGENPAALDEEKGKHVIPSAPDRFDVFLSYNSKDQEEVKEIDRRLRERGIITFLDQTDLQPGQRWRPRLEEHISQSRSGAVFIGKYGPGDWQEEEVDALLQEGKKRKAKKREFPVIPVVLEDTLGDPKIPPFLESRTRVDFRQKDPDPMERLVQSIIKSQ